MICLSCGTPNPEGAKFCNQCGLALTVKTAVEVDDLSKRLSDLLSRPDVLDYFTGLLKEKQQ